jgi:transcriptional regulator with XRE-family HTH domain
MPPSNEVHRLAALLRLALRRTGRGLREVSRRLGYHPNYLGQVLRGRVRLTVRLVLRVLAEAGISPERFFAELYGFSDLIAAGASSGGHNSDPGPAPPDAEGELRRLADRLWLRISEAGLSQREVSRRMGSQRDYVNQILRGNLELKVDHVVAILDIVEVPPEDFFADHYGMGRRFSRPLDPDERLPGGITWRELVSFFDAAAAELRAALGKGGRQRRPGAAGGVPLRAVGRARRAGAHQGLQDEGLEPTERRPGPDGSPP